MARVYVGNLPVDIREREIEDLFYKYGRIRDIDIKRPMRPPAFAFVAFDDYRGSYDVADDSWKVFICFAIFPAFFLELPQVIRILTSFP